MAIAASAHAHELFAALDESRARTPPRRARRPFSGAAATGAAGDLRLVVARARGERDEREREPEAAHLDERFIVFSWGSLEPEDPTEDKGDDAPPAKSAIRNGS